MIAAFAWVHYGAIAAGLVYLVGMSVGVVWFG